MTFCLRPDVSVVIPCYNQGRFLREAIESAVYQTHPGVEVIVVDDGSTDDTESVVRRQGAARYLWQPNQGAASARNAGLRESRGSYVIFLDADDRLLTHAVATGIQALSAHPDWAFVTGHVRVVHDDGSPASVPPQAHADRNPYIELLSANYIWAPGAVLYRRSLFEALQPFDTTAGGSADYELNLRIARRFPIGCHHQVVLEYRHHRASMSGDARYMLKSAVSVRRSQRKYVRRNRAEEEAWKAGIQIVRADFGGRVIEQVKSDLHVPGRRARAVSGMLCLLRYYPAGALRMMTAGIGRLMTTPRVSARL